MWVGLSPSATGPEDGFWLIPVASCGDDGLSLDDYLSLLDATGKPWPRENGEDGIAGNENGTISGFF